MNYVAIGSDATAEASTDTALGSELARVAATISNVTGSIYRMTASFLSTVGLGTITEYGVFDSSSAGTMLSRDTEGAIVKGASDELIVTTEITIS